MLTLPEFDELSALLWGDLDPTKFPRVKVIVGASRQPLGGLELELQVNIRNSDLQIIDRIENKFSVSPKQCIQWGGVELLHAFFDMSRRIAPRMYEYDPRIGRPLESPFPAFPLADPLDLGITGDLDECIRAAITKTQVYSSLEIEQDHSPVGGLAKCPFCQRVNFTRPGNKPSIWCGGNVGFAHQECAPWVKPNIPTWPPITL